MRACLPRATPGSATLLYLLDEANAESRNTAVGYVLEPRPTNVFEDETTTITSASELRTVDSEPFTRASRLVAASVR
jgi:hypothetical protein